MEILHFFLVLDSCMAKTMTQLNAVIDMMEFWPSEVAASTALLVLGDAQVVDAVENFPHCSLVLKVFPL